MFWERKKKRKEKKRKEKKSALQKSSKKRKEKKGPKGLSQDQKRARPPKCTCLGFEKVHMIGEKKSKIESSINGDKIPILNTVAS